VISNPHLLGLGEMHGAFQLKDDRAVFLRDFEREDFESLVDMFQGLSKEALRFGLPPYDRTRLERWTTNLDRDILLVALDGKRVVGVARIIGSALSGLKGIGTFITYIHQDYQNQGLGTQLTRSILEEARKKEFHRVSLEVVAENTAAERAYEKAGFVYEGRLKDTFYGEDGKYHDMFAMGIIL
jgi:RimJ/RimL family protein N-acetyltransferase